MREHILPVSRVSRVSRGLVAVVSRPYEPVEARVIPWARRQLLVRPLTLLLKVAAHLWGTTGEMEGEGDERGKDEERQHGRGTEREVRGKEGEDSM